LQAHVIGAFVISGPFTFGVYAPRRDGLIVTFRSAFAATVGMVDRVHCGTADGWTDAFPSFRPGFAHVGVLVLAVGEDADGGDAFGRDEAEFT
jgi:hypothetical protein